MATVKEVKVVINGEEFVSKAADSASAGMLGFVNKIPGWAQAAAVLAAAWKAIGAAVDFAKDFVMESIGIYDAYTASQGRLSAQSKLTGVSLVDLKKAAKEARDEFGLSATIANDAAVTTAKYASRAGDATQQTKLLKAALDLGAASGLTAAESMAALDLGLKNQDEGFDKLLGKNPSVLWKEYADANNLAFGAMTDTQKRMAELTAVVEAGNLVQGAYNDRLESGAGLTDRLSNKSDEMKIAFGAALQPIRILILQGLMKLVEIGTPVVVALAKITNFLGVTFVATFKLAQSTVGALAEGIGKLTGIKSLEDWGRKQAQALPDLIKELQSMEKKLNDSGTAATNAAAKHVDASGKIKKASGEAVQAVMQIADVVDIRLGKPLADLIKVTEGAIVSLSASARDQLASAPASQFENHMKGIAEHARQIEARLTGVPKQTGDSARNTRDMATDIGTVARGALDMAQAFGVVDQKAASALNSTINIATSIGRLAGGDVFGGLTGILGGVANIVSGMMANDAARRALLRANNERLAEVNSSLGNLDLNVSGRDLMAAQAALSDKTLLDQALSGGRDRTSLINALRAQGLTFADLQRIAEELGVRILNDSGSVNVQALEQLRRTLGGIELGRVSQSFADQLRFFQETQSLNGGDEFGQVQSLLQFLQNVGGVSALSGLGNVTDPQALRNLLLDVRTRLNNAGGIPNAQLGQLSGGELNALLGQIIGRLNGGGSPSTTTPLTIPTGATSPVAASKTLDDVVTSIITQQTSMQSWHTEAMTYAARTATATEGSFVVLQDIRDIVAELVAGGMDRVDADLEARRRMELLAAGQFPAIR